MPMKLKPQLLRSITKSLGYATTSAFGDLMPTVKTTMTSNKNYIAEAYNTSREKLAPSDLKQTYIFKTTDELIRNVKSDWKSGEWFNKKRQKEAEDKFFKDMGFDLDSFDFGGESSSDDSDSNVTNNNNVSNNVFMMDTGLNETVDSGISRLGNVNMSAMKVNQMGLSTISKQMSSMLDFQHDNTTKFYNDVSSKLGDIASNMAQATGFLGVMSEVSVGGTKTKQQNSQLRDLLGLEGLDLEGYAEMYKKKFMGNSGFKDTFDMLIKPMIDEWVANPLGNAMKTGIKYLMPKAFKSALGEFDQLFRFLPTMIQGKLESWKGSDNKFLAKISEIFRLDVTESKNMDFSQYEKGKVAFDGITRRAIVNVIPSLLSKILASVSSNDIHKEELVYDYEKGRFTTKKRVRKGMANDIKSFTVDSTDFKSYKEQIATENADKFESDDELKAFMKRIDNTMLRMVKKGTMINPNTKLEEISSDPQVAQAILDNFHKQSNSGKAKYQYDMLNASKSYYDVYNSIAENESFHNVFDIDTSIRGFRTESNDEMIERLKEASKWLDPNSKAGKLSSKLFSMISPEDEEFNVENNLNSNNPFYWLTEGLRDGNSAIADFFFGNGTGNNNPRPKNDDEPSTSNPTPPNDDNVIQLPLSEGNESSTETSKKKKGVMRFFSLIGDMLNDENSTANNNNVIPFVPKNDSSARIKGSNDDINNTMQEHLQEREERKLTGGVSELTNSIHEVTEVIKDNQSNIVSTNNSTSKSDDNYLNLLPKINDNILHIIALLEAKFGNEGVQVNKIGKLKGKFSEYKNRTFEWFNKFFNRNNDGNNGEENGGKKGLLGGIFDSILGTFKRGEGKGSLIKRLIGKDGIISSFLTKTFDTITDVVKNNLPKIKDSLFNFSESFLNFSGEVLATALDLGQKGLDRGKGFLKDLRDKRGQRGGQTSGSSGLFGSILGGLGTLGESIMSLGGKAIGGIKGFFDKDGTSSGKGKKFSFSIPEIFDKIFNKDKGALEVFVDGGHLDGIREVIKITNHVGDRNTAQEQIEDFENAQDLRDVNRKGHVRKALDDKVRGYLENDKNGGGLLGGALTGVVTDIVGEIAGEVIGNSIGRRRNRRGSNGNGNGGSNLPDVIDAVDVGSDLLDNGQSNGRPRREVGRRRGIGGRIANGLSSIKNRVLGRRGNNNPDVIDMDNPSGRRGSGRLGKGLKMAGKVGKGLLRGAKFIPGVGLVVGGAMGVADAVSGFASGGSAFGTDPTLGQRFAGAGGSLLSGLSFGLMNEKTTSEGLYRMFGGDKQEEAYENSAIRPKGSYADGGVIDYTGTANVHGSKDKPEMVLNAEQTTGFFNQIRQMSIMQKQKDMETEREKTRGEYSNDPAIKTAHWMEQLGKFFSKTGVGGMLFGGMLGGILGKTVGGIFGKVGGFFKDLWSKLTGTGTAEASGSGGSTGPTDYSGSTNAQKAWNFFKSKGFTDEATAGILGNLQQESGINPTQKQLGGGPGRGLMQWEKGGRWDQLVKWANANGKDPMSMETQLDYMWLEMTEKEKTGISILNKRYGGMEGLKSTTDYKQATMAFEDSFERAGKPNYEKRYQFASDFLNEFKGTSGTGSGGDPNSTIGGSARDKVVKGGQTYVGRLKYAFGGTNIEGGSGDCSAFTRHVFQKYASHKLGRTTGDQVLQGSKVADGSEQPGDLVFFKGTYNSSHPFGVSHVGIVIGNGQMVHLSSSGCNVASYKSGYWGQHYLMVRSYLSGGSSSNDSSSGSGESTATPKVDDSAQKSRDGWYDDIWGKEYDGKYGYSNSTSGWDGGPSSSYNGINSFTRLGAVSGTALSGGLSYVGNQGSSSGGDPIMKDLRWAIGNSVINNANSSLVTNMDRMNSLNENLLASGLPSAYGVVPSSSPTSSSSVVNNKTMNEILDKNSDDISLMQNLMKQLNETSQKGNDTLSQMLDVLVEIREQSKNGGISTYIPVPMPNGGKNGSNGSNGNNGSSGGSNNVTVIDSSGFGGGSTPFTGTRGSGAGSSQPSSQELSTLLAGY
jgi:cell wall-associated NlpC family hydrolase